MATTATTTTTATERAPALGDLHYRRILVALDGSANAELALSGAVRLAQEEHACITLMTVVPDVMAELTRWPAVGISPQELQLEADKEAEARMRDAVERMPNDLSVTTVVRRGKAGPQIVAYAREHDHDAIMLGARGVGRVQALIGSVSSYVLHHADAAVFVTHAPRDRAA